jgi:hypothetical protein
MMAAARVFQGGEQSTSRGKLGFHRDLLAIQSHRIGIEAGDFSFSLLPLFTFPSSFKTEIYLVFVRSMFPRNKSGGI